MSDKVFFRLLIAVAVAGVLSLVALTLYTVYLYNHVSIISYIANAG